MPLENFTAVGLIPQIFAAGQEDNIKENPVFRPPSDAAAIGAAVAVNAAAAGDGHDNGAVGGGPMHTPAVWSDSRPLADQLATYPATFFLAVTFVSVFIVMSKRRVSPAAMGSSYRHLVVRSEWWRVLTAAFTHSGLLHVAFNVSSLWACRRLEAELGSWVYLLASAHLLVLGELFEKTFMHALFLTGRLIDEASTGYSGVIFAWMAVLSLKPDAPTRVIGGVVFGGFAYVLFNLVVIKIMIRRSSFVGHMAGVWAGLVFSAGGLEFARQRYWGTGIAAWALMVLLGSIKATTTVPVPLVDFVDVTGRNDLGVGVVPFDWGNREDLEDYVLANA